MRRTILFLILFVYSEINSQTVINPLEYFPIHYGDVWTYQYIEYDYFNDDTLSISYRTFEVTGDTILTDGYKYFVFSYGNNYGFALYYRIDTLNLTVRNQYYGEYYLNATPDSIWTDEMGVDNYVSLDTSEVGALGISKPQIVYEQGYGVFNRTLSKGFGLSYSEEGDLGIHLRTYLIYAEIDGQEYGTPVGVQNENNSITRGFSLSQNYPNPFNPSTTINYSLKEKGFVQIIVYDVLGKEMAILVNEEKRKGNYSVKFNGENLPSGTYFYKIVSGHFTEVKKMILLR